MVEQTPTLSPKIFLLSTDQSAKRYAGAPGAQQSKNKDTLENYLVKVTQTIRLLILIYQAILSLYLYFYKSWSDSHFHLLSLYLNLYGAKYRFHIQSHV